MKIIMRDIQERFWPVCAGVIDKNIQRTRRVDGFFHRVAVHHVQLDRFGAATLGTNGRGHRLDFGQGARRQQNMRASIGQRGGGGQANATPGAGDQCALAVQAETRRAR